MHAVEIADGDLIYGNQKGKVVVNKLNGAVLDDVVYVPGLKQTLISVKQLVDKGMKVEFTDKECLIYDQPIMRGSVYRGTPIDKGVILYRRSPDEESAGDVPYRQAVGALLYLTLVTRPGIAYAVNQVAAQASDPSKTHWIAVKNILRYIAGTFRMGLVYNRNVEAVHVHVYTDADWANHEEDRKSVSGVLVQVFGCPVSWQTKRQRIVSKSSTIAEYLTTDDGVEEAVWTKMLLERLMKTQDGSAIPAMMDNKSTDKRLTNGKSSEAQKTPTGFVINHFEICILTNKALSAPSSQHDNGGDDDAAPLMYEVNAALFVNEVNKTFSGIAQAASVLTNGGGDTNREQINKRREEEDELMAGMMPQPLL
ncbi:unnamed protein product [Phytophthora fragariaefolia]|uniref:Unnamed protein product n=1 Tax=Phytophthora fragariaefolia TaxID=1490495 RepID=A0A9W7D5W5_9STRA|nr:unnamed protein product [Phytophthora fragariaefolia]